MAQILDGRELAKNIKRQISADIQNLPVPPKLAIVVATDDESTQTYVRSISKAGEKIGVNVEVHNLGETASYDDIAEKLAWLDKDAKVHGIILQTPLPENLQPWVLQSMIPLEKDVDGANPESFGSLGAGIAVFAPATAQAVMEILNEYKVPLQGANTVIVGRSRVVGKPVAALLLESNATVTIAHSKTKDLASLTKNADVLVVATGKTNLITTNHITTRSVVIDVGTNVDSQGKLVGDVDFAGVEPIVKAITPVPGGVGPVTTAVLLKQVCQAAKQSL